MPLKVFLKFFKIFKKFCLTFLKFYENDKYFLGFGENSKANGLNDVHLKPGTEFEGFNQITDLKKFKKTASFYPVSKLNQN